MTGRKLIGVICLLAYLLAWVTGAQVAPVLVTLAGHAHKTFISYEGHGVRLILHHPGNADEHEAVPGPHRHDALDRFIVAVTGLDTHTDHVVRLPAGEHPAVLAAEGTDAGKACGPLPFTGYAFPAFVRTACVHLLAQPPPRVDPRLAHLRSTLLLI
jgi:hypothetical protein